MSSQLTTFWKYLEGHEVKIPIIQRDYAQGRAEETEKRKRFLKSLHKALTDGDPLKLDFVYGTNVDNAMQPLDGQQRLTTLWLLHWYFAAKVGMTGKNTDVSNILKRFSYETRSSSRDFCERLAKFQLDFDLVNKQTQKKVSIAEQIKNQTWFNSAWIQDPTISSMLRMLSGDDNSDNGGGDNIEAVFEKIAPADTWERFTKSNGKICPIFFYEFDMGTYGLTDDLYIKMNARGEQLSACENFKADLLGYIDKHKNFNIDGIDFAAKWDNDWTNIFWKNRLTDVSNDFGKKWANRADEIFFAFINRFWFNHIITSKSNDGAYPTISEEALQNTPCYNQELRYDSFNHYEQLKPEYKDKSDQYHNEVIIQDCQVKNAIDNLIKILDSYPKISCLEHSLSSPRLDREDNEGGKTFIPKYDDTNKDAKDDPIKTISQPQRVVFFAICKFLTEIEKLDNGYDLDTRFNRWMRVVWNLVSIKDKDGKATIRSVGQMRRAMELINDLENSQLVYESLVKYNMDPKWESALELQFKEEIDKARQILNADGSLKAYDGSKDKTWEDVIIEAENTVFFNGSIRFLFTNADGEVNWQDFDTKWQNAQNYFGDKGVNDDYREDAKLLRRLLTLCSVFGQLQAIRYDSTKENWHDVLLNKDLSSPVHNILTNDDALRYDFARYTSDLSDQKQKFVQEFLVKEQIYSCLPDGWYLVPRPTWDAGNGIYDLDPHNRGSHQYFIIHPRINLLRNQGIDILNSVPPYAVRTDGFKRFWGVDIFFSYEAKIFRWHIKDNNEECDVYLWDATNNNRATRPSAPNDANEDEKYYCFKVTDYNDGNSFKGELDNLITRFGEDN